MSIIVFFFNDTATTEIYTLSLHDALPICTSSGPELEDRRPFLGTENDGPRAGRVLELGDEVARSEEHTSELQSRQYLVCRLLLEKKKTPHNTPSHPHYTYCTATFLYMILS